MSPGDWPKRVVKSNNFAEIGDLAQQTRRLSV